MNRIAVMLWKLTVFLYCAAGCVGVVLTFGALLILSFPEGW